MAGKLADEIYAEHCERIDSRERFTEPDRGVSTTSEWEYWFVVDPSDDKKRELKMPGGAWPTEDPRRIGAKSAGDKDASIRRWRKPQQFEDFEFHFNEYTTPPPHHCSPCLTLRLPYRTWPWPPLTGRVWPSAHTQV